MGEKGTGIRSLGPEDSPNLWGGVRELPEDLVGEGGANSSKGGRDLLSISKGGGLVTQIFILLRTTSCYPVKNRYWPEAINQSHF